MMSDDTMRRQQLAKITAFICYVFDIKCLQGYSVTQMWTFVIIED